MNRILRLFTALTALTLATALPAKAQSLNDILQAELLPGWRTETGTHMAAIRLTMAQGWKTYWRSPGDAGIPPEFNWQGSENLGRIELHWPAPEVFHFNGMQSIGYSRELILPVEIWPRTAGRPVTLKTEMGLGICRDICVPAVVNLAAPLLPEGRPDPAIRQAIRAQPVSGRAAGLSAARCRLEPEGRGLKLTVDLTMPRLGPDEVVVLEAPGRNTWISDTETRRQGQQLSASAEIVSLDGSPVALQRSDLRITVLAGGKAAETIGCSGR